MDKIKKPFSIWKKGYIITLFMSLIVIFLIYISIPIGWEFLIGTTITSLIIFLPLALQNEVIKNEKKTV